MHHFISVSIILRDLSLSLFSFFLSLSTSDELWFKSSAMGVNKLSRLTKTMSEKADLDEKRRLTNHSTRKTIMQKLNDHSVPPTHIMELSRHKNVQSVNNYRITFQKNNRKT